LRDNSCKTRVIPAKAGIQRLSLERHWVPAFAGTTILLDFLSRNYVRLN